MPESQFEREMRRTVNAFLTGVIVCCSLILVGAVLWFFL